MSFTSSSSLFPEKIPAMRWWRIVPPIVITCIISYMDRLNLSFALPGGMDAELGISPQMAGFAAGFFFIGYIFLQIPGGKLAVNGNGKRFIGWSLLAWAVISILTGMVTETWELLVLRFALGVAEGGLLPVALTMIGNWFPDAERGRANAIVIMFVPLAGIITAPLSGWIITDWDWRMLFYVEGVISLIVMALWYFTISNRPEEAKWISPEEKNYLIKILHDEQLQIKDKNVRQASLWNVIRMPIMWHLIVVNFLYQFGIYGYNFWLPSILKELTNGNMEQVGFLATLPFVGAIFGMFLFSFLSDSTGRRRLYVALPLICFATCLALSVILKEHVWWSYVALVGCGVFFQSAAGGYWTIPPRLFNAETAGGARGFINAVSNLGGFCGPYIVGLLGKDAGIYSLAIGTAIAAVLALMLPAHSDSKQRNRA